MDKTSPSSFLWAHEIRRENIHLINQIDGTKADLVSTTTTLKSLQQTVISLEEAVQRLTASTTTAAITPPTRDNESDAHDELARRLTELEGGVNARLKHWSTQVEELQKENGRFSERFEVVKRELDSSIERRWKKMEDGMREQAMASVQDLLAREVEGLRCTHGLVNPDAHEPSSKTPELDLVPDSMPTASLSEPKNESPLQTLSQSTVATTTCSSSQRPADASYYHNHQAQDKDCDPDPSSDVENYRMIKQDGGSLVGYLAFAEATRSRLPPRQREGRIVEVFLAGLDDTEVKGLLERRLDEEGWAWNVLGTLVQKVIKEREDMARQGQLKRAMGDGEEVKRKKEKRRCIPIVPVDEDDFV